MTKNRTLSNIHLLIVDRDALSRNRRKLEVTKRWTSNTA